VCEVRRLRELEAERKIKKLLAEAELDKAALRICSIGKVAGERSVKRCTSTRPDRAGNTIRSARTAR
jgi:hypothetical protein